MAFREDLLEFFKEQERRLPNFRPATYYHIISTSNAIKDIILDIEKYEYNISSEYDSNYYCRSNIDLDKFFVFLHKKDGESADYYYSFILDLQDEFLGYCECNPDDDGYVVDHKCCGVNCDWEAPIVKCEKIYEILQYPCSGSITCAKDVWNLENDWINENQERYKAEISMIEKKIDKFQDSIDELNKRKTEIEKKSLKTANERK